MKLLSVRVLRRLRHVFLILENKYIIDLIYLIHTFFKKKWSLGFVELAQGRALDSPPPAIHTVSTAIVIIISAVVVTRAIAAVFRSTYATVFTPYCGFLSPSHTTHGMQQCSSLPHFCGHLSKSLAHLTGLLSWGATSWALGAGLQMWSFPILLQTALVPLTSLSQGNACHL